MINPVSEYTHIAKWINTLVNKKITPKNFARRLSTQLTSRHPVRVKVHQDTKILDKDDFTIGAEYDSDLDERNKKQFIINLIINHHRTTPWIITADIANRFALEMTEAMVHEYQHQHQYRSRKHILNRGFKSTHQDRAIREDQEYLGHPDEIDAYAKNIAARIYILTKDKNSCLQTHSLDLKQYFVVFGKNHKVTKRLLKKIYKNIEIFIALNNKRRKKKNKSVALKTQ